MIRIVIADDHAVVRRGLVLIVSGEPDMQIVGEAETGDAALQLLSQVPCDVLLMDITMPGRSGLDVLGDVRARYPQLAVLILSMFREDQYALRALKAGAAGYLTKEMAPEELVRAVRKVCSGGRYVSEALAERLSMLVGNKNERLPHEMLSEREFQVLVMLASGKPVSEVAADMSLSVNTVSTYRSRILDKMHLKTNTELARYALQHGLIV